MTSTQVGIWARTTIPITVAMAGSRARGGLPAADRRHHDRGDQHRGGEAIDAAELRAFGHAISEHDVDREQDRVGERKGKARGGAGELDVGQQIDAGYRERQRDQVTRGAGADHGQDDDGQELDRRDGTERQPADRGVEAHVHDREHGTPGQQQPTAVAVKSTKSSPGRAPEGKDDRG